MHCLALRKVLAVVMLYTLLVDSSIVIMAGSTVNMCAIDLTKAFDMVNHHALFTKLMKRQFLSKYQKY